jgi:hypothetical protein
MTVFDTDSILPPPPEGAVPVLHDREYRVQSYRLADDRVLIQAALRDQRPPGLSIPGDPDPLTVHHMTVEIEVTMPKLEIVAARTNIAAHPHNTCTDIVTRYDALVGLSIARGFTHKIRELFGGPRGCTHTTALLQAMAPVAVQSRNGHRTANAIAAGDPHPLGREGGNQHFKHLTNTCHVWAEDGPKMIETAVAGFKEPMLTVRRRLDELGLDDRGRPLAEEAGK